LVVYISYIRNYFYSICDIKLYAWKEEKIMNTDNVEKFSTLKDYCHWINWHVGELVLRKNVAYDIDGNILAECIR
jgi:hypothetical protein